MTSEGREGPPAEAADDRSPIEPAGVAEELRWHEELLRRGAAAVRVRLVRERALSYGLGVREEAPYLRRARERGLATARRSSGGTGILHLEGDVLWALVLPRANPKVGRDFARAYGRLGEGLVTGLEAVGVRARWADAPGLAEAYCPLSSRGQVLAVDGGVLGGAAQHATSATLLHHGSVSWAVDRQEVDRLFDLPAGGPSLRLVGVAELQPRTDARGLAEALWKALAAAGIG